MAACIKVTKLKITRTGLERENVIIPMTRVDEAREVRIQDPELNQPRLVSELLKVNGDVLLLDNSIHYVQRQMEQA